MGMNGARGAQREAGLGCRARRVQDLHEVQHRAEVSRLELQRAPQVMQAFVVPSLQVVQDRAFVPGLGEVGNASQQQRKAGLGDVEAPRRDIVRGELESARGGVMRVVHPHVPDPVFGFLSLRAGAAREAAEQLIEERRSADRPPGAIAADQSENFNQ